MTTEAIPTVDSRWLRTDKDNRGKGIHATVTKVEEGYVGTDPFVRVHYKPDTQRAGKMLLKDFLANFAPAVDVAPEPAQLVLPTVDPNAAPLARVEQKLDLLLALYSQKAAA